MAYGLAEAFINVEQNDFLQRIFKQKYDEQKSVALANKPVVVAHQKLCFERLHWIENNGDQEEEAGGGDGQCADIGEKADEEREDGHEPEEECAAPGDARDNADQVGLSRSPRADAGDECA